MRNEGEDFAIGPVTTPLGAAMVQRKNGTLILRRGDDIIFTSDRQGRLEGPITGA